MPQLPKYDSRILYGIIIPAHNEELRIEATLHDYITEFPDAEILVVLNGCTDRTRAIVDRLAAHHSRFVVIDVPQAVGKGGAIRIGFIEAQAEQIAFVDADGATKARELRRLFNHLHEGVDAVIGSRWVKGATVETKQPFLRRLASRVFNTCVKTLFAMPYADTQCGAKVFRRRTLDLVIHRVETANLAFDVDLLFTLKQVGAAIKEVPTVWKDIGGTTVNLASSATKMLAALLRLRLKYSFFGLVIPLFDRLFPTAPIRLRDKHSILILNWRDPQHPSAGGAETYLFELAKRWVAQGNVVEWLTAGFRGCAREVVLEGVKIRRVGNAVTLYPRVMIEYIKSYRDRFDVIVDSENGIPFFSPFFSLKKKICVMHHVHQQVFRAHLPFPISEIFAWIERVAMPWAYRDSRFIAVSNDTKTAMQKLGMTKHPVEIVANGVDPGLESGHKAERPTILYLGRLKAYKRVELLVQAIPALIERIPDIVLKIAGTGDREEALRRLVHELNLEEHVVFEGYVSGERKKQLLQEAWVFATASEMEGWGIAVLEANACGTPAVAYRVPGLREAIVSGESGLLIDARENLAEPIARIILDPVLLRGLERGAVKRAAQFTWDSSAAKFLDIIMRRVAGDSYSIVRYAERWMIVSGENTKKQSLPAVVVEEVPLSR